MAQVRIALANLRVPENPEQSVEMAVAGVRRAGAGGADIVCFPECYVPGYRGLGMKVPTPDARFLEAAWSAVALAAAESSVAVVLGTERVHTEGLRIAALVIDRNGAMLGFQDKVQLDPSEDHLYTPGADRHVFRSGPLVFGISICHEGWRYPETVRYAAARGAHIVFHPHFHPCEAGAYVPSVFADPANTFHEKAALCRAAENSCYFATVNCAIPNSPTTSAVVNPDGTVLCYQPYGEEGLLLADIETSLATRLLATRYRTV